MTDFNFLVGNREAEMKPTTLFSLLLFCILFFFPLPPLMGLGLEIIGSLYDPCMAQGIWVGDLHTISFYLLVSVLLFIPYECISCPGWGWVFHLLCLDPFPFLGIDVSRPRNFGI